MRIVDRKFVDKTYTTRTRQHFGALLGEKPHNGAVVRMYPRLTISNLTEGLKRVH
jgi:hypothetical protein